MAFNTFTDPVLIKSRPHEQAEAQVGAEDPLGRADVLNRPDKSLTAWVKRLLNSLVSGETLTLSDPATTGALPVSIVQSVALWTMVGSPAPDGHCVVPDASGSARVRPTSGKTLLPVGVSMFPVAELAQGAFGHAGVLTVKTAGPVARGSYIFPALSPVGTVADSGIVQQGTNTPPVGSIGVALSAAGAAGSTIWAYVWGYGYMTGEVPQAATEVSSFGPAMEPFTTYADPVAVVYQIIPGLSVTIGTGTNSRLVIGLSGHRTTGTGEVAMTVAIDDVVQPTMHRSTIEHISASMMSAPLAAGTHVVAGRIWSSGTVLVDAFRLVVWELAF